MQHKDEPRAGADSAPVAIVLPLLPGQSEPWRRFLQELEARRGAFEVACRRWGICALISWLAFTRAGDLVIVQVVPVTSFADVDERFAPSRQPFDRWFTERAREFHGVDLSLGFARYRAEALAQWPEESAWSAGMRPTSPAG